MNRLVFSLAFLSSFLLLSAAEPKGDKPLQTVAEESDYKKTSSDDEVLDFCAKLAERSKFVRYETLCQSTDKRKLPLLILSDPPVASAEEAKKSGKLVVYVQGNIHAGEVDGKEGLLALARDIVEEKDRPLLKDLIILMTPNINPDGNDKFAKDSRPWQNGPAEVGMRHNGQDLDLNRDWVKLETPEARGIVKLCVEWQPVMFIDCHTTNGSYHQYTMEYDGPRHPAVHEGIVSYANNVMLPDVGKRLEKRSGYKSYFYGDFTEDHKGWEVYVPMPRYGMQWAGFRHSFGILSESYMMAPYKDRVLATRDLVRSSFEFAAEHKDKIRKTIADARDADVQAGKKPRERDLIPLRIKAAVGAKGVKILGVVEEKKDGKTVPTKTPKDYTVDYLGNTETTLSVRRPFAYVFPKKLDKVADKLREHGIEVGELKKDAELTVETYKIDKITKAKDAFQRHHLATLDATPGSAKRKLEAGSVLVRTSQPFGTLACYLLEPQCEDGLAAWNFFDDVKEGQDFPVVRIVDPVELP